MSSPKSARFLGKWRVAAAGAALIALLLVFAFPGGRLLLAFTLATGIRTQLLQEQIDRLEESAIRRRTFSQEEREFLSDFYRTLATGAKLTLVVRQTGRLMDHYLDGSGAEYRLNADIFTENAKLKAHMAVLRRKAATLPCGLPEPLSSPRFYMPDPSKTDSVYGLYWGRLLLSKVKAADGACQLAFRAEVPWSWPSYPELQQKYGDYHAESFPLPNLASLCFGRSHALFVDNGLGQYLAEIGIAKPFVAFAEWTE